MEYLFFHEKIGRTIATTGYDNLPSQKVMEKLGMKVQRLDEPQAPDHFVVGVIEIGFRKTQMNKDFDNVLSSFNTEIQDIARETRAIIFEILPPVVEVVWERQKIAGYGTGAKKMTEHFCWIAPYKKHVVLGFNYGSELPDPDHILEGTGKLFRHVKLNKIDDVHNPSIQNLIKVATKHRVPPPREK